MDIKYKLPPLPSNIVEVYNKMTRDRKQFYKRQASQMSTLCKLLKVSIGTVVLAFPEGFSQVYISGGLIVLVICGLLQYYSWCLLIRVIEEKAEIKKQQDLIEKEYKEKQLNQVEIELVQQENKDNDSVNNVNEVKSELVIDQGPYQMEETIGEEIFDDIEDEDLKQVAIEEEKFKKDINNPLTKKKIMFEKMNMIGVMKAIDPKSRILPMITKVMTILLFYGQAVSLLIFIKQTIDQVIPGFQNNDVYTIYLALTSIGLIMAFSFVTRLETLRPLTNIGSYLVFIVMYFLTSVCLYQIKSNTQNEITKPQINYGVNFKEIPFFFGVTLYSYDINGILTEIREEMKHPEKFRKVVAKSMFLCCVIYSLFGVCGYLAFGDDTNEIITENLTDVVSDIGIGIENAFYALQIVYALSMIQTVILQNVVCIRMMEELPYDFRKTGSNQHFNIWIKLTIRFLYISGCVFGGYFLENFSTIVSLIGCIPSVYLGFVMPYYLFKLVFGRQKIYIEIFNGFVVFLGVAGAILGVIQIFSNIL